MKNPYLPMPMRIRRIFVESDDGMLKTFDLEFMRPEDEEGFSFIPGQFCVLSVFGKGEAPFGIASAPHETGYVRFTVNRTGLVTNALHGLKEGDEVGLRGPLGNGFPLDVFKGHDMLVIGGGFAFTTLRSLVAHVLHTRIEYGEVNLVYGARRPGMLLYREELEAWDERDDIKVHLTVDMGDDTWTRRVGLVPVVAKEIAPSSENAYAIVTGPPIMIRFTLPVLHELGFPRDRTYTSLERRMKCGIGKCGRCNIGPYYVCKDGPVFRFSQLDGLPREF